MTFADAVDQSDLDAAAAALGAPLPADLVGLLSETNGVSGEFGLGLVWPLARIVEDNLLFRHTDKFVGLYMSFEPLLFFGDAGNGDQFGYSWTTSSCELYAWDHEDDSRRWIAPTLERYLIGWLDGTIRL